MSDKCPSGVVRSASVPQSRIWEALILPDTVLDRVYKKSAESARDGRCLEMLDTWVWLFPQCAMFWGHNEGAVIAVRYYKALIVLYVQELQGVLAVC
jgi:hypothetical protein